MSDVGPSLGTGLLENIEIKENNIFDTKFIKSTKGAECQSIRSEKKIELFGIKKNTPKRVAGGELEVPSTSLSDRLTVTAAYDYKIEYEGIGPISIGK